MFYFSHLFPVLVKQTGHIRYPSKITSEVCTCTSLINLVLKIKNSSCQPTMISNVLREGFQLGEEVPL